MIRITKLNKFFNQNSQNEIHVINDVNLELPEKGLVAIFGRSGCGKTTLLNVIGGLDKVDSGDIIIGGNNIKNNTDILRNKYIGYIFQNYNLNKQETVFNNVAAALRLCGMTDSTEIEERVVAALKNVGMEKYKLRTPDTLSGGQQQRIAVARALVKNPRIILADEPTGNLDDENTILIMDLLKQISKEHLVLLVTHEANLVDHYCDKVIEIVDGRINSIRDNDETPGLVQRNKNDIYLGEYEKKTVTQDSVELEYYGEVSPEKINIKLINDKGRFYVKIADPRVKIVSASSEMKIKEGVYQKQKREIDMSKLTPFEGKRFGKLFSLRSAIASGYKSNFSRQKKGTKLLKISMATFALVAVIMSAVFGKAFRDFDDVQESYNHNTFFVYLNEASDLQQIRDNVGKNGIDYYRLESKNPEYMSTNTMTFKIGNFETFTNSYAMSLTAKGGMYFENTLASGLKTVAERTNTVGGSETFGYGDIIITTAIADKLLESSKVDYIKDYTDLLGLITSNRYLSGIYLRIVKIVESTESVFYVHPLVLADITLSNQTTLKVDYLSASSQIYSGDLDDGKTVYVNYDSVYGMKKDFEVKRGQTITLNGKDFVVDEILQWYPNYNDWYIKNVITGTHEEQDYLDFIKQSMQRDFPAEDEKSDWYLDEFENRYRGMFFEYFAMKEILKDNASLKYGSEEYYNKYNEIYFEIENKFYSKLDNYLSFRLDFFPYDYENRYAWVYLNKDIDALKYYFYPNAEQSYYAELYKNTPANDNKYPAYNSEELMEFIQSKQKPYFEVSDQLVNQYQQEYENWANTNYNYKSEGSYYIVTDKDYVSLSKSYGKTHSSAASEVYRGGDGWYNGGGKPVNNEEKTKEYIDNVFYGENLFIVVHSNNVSATEQFLKDKFGGRQIPYYSDDMDYSVVTPDDIFNYSIKSIRGDITVKLIAMGVILGILSLCMYFIMRSSLMAKIKEIGIYRAIGVSRMNLTFKILVEVFILTTFTVFVGFFISSGLLLAWLGNSPLMGQLFYYPVWLAGVILVILYAVCLICGILPAIMLLRKTPSEIMAKYDI